MKRKAVIKIYLSSGVTLTFICKDNEELAKLRARFEEFSSWVYINSPSSTQEFLVQSAQVSAVVYHFGEE